MGFDEAKVNRNAPGSSEGGQFAAKDAGRASAGQVGDAFGVDAEVEQQASALLEAIGDDWTRYQRRSGEAGFDSEYARPIEHLLATGEQSELLGQWTARRSDAIHDNEQRAIAEAARTLGMDAGTLDAEVRERVLEHLRDHDSDPAFRATMADTHAVLATPDEPLHGHLDTDDPTANLTDAARRLGADVHDPEVLRGLRRAAGYMEQHPVEFGGDTQVHTEFTASLAEVEGALNDSNGRMVPGAVMKVGDSISVPLGRVPVHPQPGELRAVRADWKVGESVRPRPERMLDTHGFDPDHGFESKVQPDGSRLHTQRSGDTVRTHTVRPDGTHEWAEQGPHISRRSALHPSGRRTSEVVAGQALHREVVDSEGTKRTYSTDGITTTNSRTLPSGVWQRDVSRHDGGMVNESGTDTSLEREVYNGASQRLVRTSLFTTGSDLMGGTHTSPLTGDRPLDVTLRRRGGHTLVEATDRRSGTTLTTTVASDVGQTNAEVGHEAIEALEARLRDIDNPFRR